MLNLTKPNKKHLQVPVPILDTGTKPQVCIRILEGLSDPEPQGGCESEFKRYL